MEQKRPTLHIKKSALSVARAVMDDEWFLIAGCESGLGLWRRTVGTMKNKERTQPRSAN
jgi:hypothetical protein